MSRAILRLAWPLVFLAIGACQTMLSGDDRASYDASTGMVHGGDGDAVDPRDGGAEQTHPTGPDAMDSGHAAHDGGGDGDVTPPGDGDDDGDDAEEGGTGADEGGTTAEEGGTHACVEECPCEGSDCCPGVCPPDNRPRTTGGWLITMAKGAVTRDMELRAMARPALPSLGNDERVISLRDVFVPPRDQGERPTSAAFAAIGLAEYYEFGDLSEECVIERTGTDLAPLPDERLKLLSSHGAVSESACPYVPSSPGAPSTRTEQEYDASVRDSGAATLLEYVPWSQPAPDSLKAIVQSLRVGAPAIAVLPVLDDSGWFDNRPIIEVPGTPTCDGTPFVEGSSCPLQVVLVVGYDPVASTLLIRNSWGPAWKDGGYARVRAEYVHYFAHGSGGLHLKYTPAAPRPGDFDGDGIDDVIIVTASGSALYLGDPIGQLKASTFSRPDLTLHKVRFHRGDFNCDDRMDVLVETAKGTDLLVGHATQGLADGGFHSDVLKLGLQRFTTGDFDGDGCDDFIATSASGSFSYRGKADGSFEAGGFARANLPLGTTNFVPGDVNGDGRTDVMIVSRRGSYVYLGNAAGGFDSDAAILDTLSFGTVDHFPLDANGDGRTDFVTVRSTGGQLLLGLETGELAASGWAHPSRSFNDQSPFGPVVRYVNADISGDGKSDAFISTGGGSFAYRSTGSSFVPDVYPRKDLPLGRVQVMASDFNHDGRSDLLLTTATGSFVYSGKPDGTLTPDTYQRLDLPIYHVAFF